MNKINNLNREVRNFINNSIIKKTLIFSKKDKGDWNIFFSALDNIDDASMAIKLFEEMDEKMFSQNPYLHTYGLLQALIIQQDALNFLIEYTAGNSEMIDFYKGIYCDLGIIRDIRNKTIGHPVFSGPKKNNKSETIKYEDGSHFSCTISRETLKKDGFEYLLRSYLSVDIKVVNFKDILKKQESLLELKLEDIINKLKKEEEKHKLKFKDNKLSSAIDRKSNIYDLNLIYGVSCNDTLSWASFDYFFGNYKDVKKGLKDRYGDLSGTIKISGTVEILNKLDYIFTKLEYFKKNKNFDKYEFEIFVDSLKNEIEALKSHLKDIDEEFLVK